MKAIIPVAGIGTRLRPHTHTVPKALLPVAGNTILGHIIDELLQYDIEEITFIELRLEYPADEIDLILYWSCVSIHG